jgi:hypothetical protein
LFQQESYKGRVLLLGLPGCNQHEAGWDLGCSLVAAVVVVVAAAAAAAASQSALDKLQVVLHSFALGLTPERSLGGRFVVLVDLAGSCHHELEENSTAHSIALA